MYRKYFRRLHIITVICCFFIYSKAQNRNYDFASWDGKNGASKNNIEIPERFLKKYNACLAIGSDEYSFFYKVPLDKNDTIRNGRFQSAIFLNSEEAQRALVNYLNELTTPKKPARLNIEDYNIGDIAFGDIISGILYLVFTRNNVLVFVQAETNTAKEIAIEFDNLIQKSSDWTKDNLKPCFKLKPN
jgi:hypothetical protein